MRNIVLKLSVFSLYHLTMLKCMYCCFCIVFAFHFTLLCLRQTAPLVITTDEKNSLGEEGKATHRKDTHQIKII